MVLVSEATGLGGVLALYLGIFIGLPLVIAIVVGIVRIGRSVPPIDTEPATVLQRPGRTYSVIKARRFARELGSPAVLAIVVGSFVVPAAAVWYATRNAHPNLSGSWATIFEYLPLIAGTVGLLFGRWPATDVAEGRARRYAADRVRAALSATWAQERTLLDRWGGRRGLVPAAVGRTVPRSTPLLRECIDLDCANVLAGSVGAIPSTVFHLTQLGDYGLGPAGGEDVAPPSFRWFTCVVMKPDQRDLAFTLRPRKVKLQCPLNELAPGVVGEAWRQSPATPEKRPPPPEQPGLPDERAQEVIGRMIAAGQLPPQLVELQRRAEKADAKQREEIGREAGALVRRWREERGIGGARAAIGAFKALRGDGFRDVELESVEFNKRYRLRVRDPDNLEIVAIFDPALIVEATGMLDEMFVELENDVMLVAVPSRLLDAERLDRLLAYAGALAWHIDRSPRPA